MIGNREISRILKATAGRHHYVALGNMFKNYPSSIGNLFRYLTAKGAYPYEIQIRTPTGLVRPVLYSHHDLLTVNEIFCRLDYPADQSINVVVDIGSNIGISALYFLSRNSKSRVHLFEPDPKNIVKLRKTLEGFEDRYSLTESAVSDSKGTVEFGVEETGRYGGIGVEGGESIRVQCLHVNDVLKEVLSKETFVDVLKIDTEGVEIQTVLAIAPEYLKRIRRIYIEATPKEKIHPDLFEQRQYGTVFQMNLRKEL